MTGFRKVFQFERDADLLIVLPQGEVGAFQAADVQSEYKALLELIKSPDVGCLLIDLSSAPYFGSTVIGAIATLCVTMRGSGGKAAMCAASKDMYEVLRTMQFDNVLPYFPTREAALASLRGA